MALEVKIPTEIRNYKESVLLGMNAKQLACAASVVLVSAGIVIVGINYTSLEVLSTICIILALPAALIGWYKWQEMPMEVAIPLLIRYFINPQRRKYIENNYFDNARIAIIKEEMLRSEDEKRRQKK